MKREDLQERYAKLSLQELLKILDNKHDYTDLAVTVAFEELSKRNITEEDIREYKEDQVEQAEKFIVRNIVDDLNLLQKNLFFFIWIPIITFAVRQNFRDDGYMLKLRQANYYSLTGFISLILAVLISVYFDFNTLSTLAIWILLFLPAYSFDEFFNRRRQIEALRRLFKETESPSVKE